MTMNLRFSAFARRCAVGLAGAGAARPLVFTTAFDEVAGVASIWRIGVTGRRALRSAVFGVEEVCAGTIVSRMTCSLTTGVITFRPALMPRPSIAIALSFNSTALLEVPPVVAGRAVDGGGGGVPTGFVSTMVFMAEGSGGIVLEDEMRGAAGCTRIGSERTTVFIPAIGEEVGGRAGGDDDVTKALSSGPGGGSMFNIARASRGRLSSSLSSARMITSAVCLEI